MSSQLPLRIMLPDVWNHLPLMFSDSTTVGDVKRKALSMARLTGNPDQYVVKFRGAEVADAATLAEAGIVADANLIVLRRRRQPVR